MEAFESDILIVGGGIIGLSIAAAVSRRHTVILVEKNPQFGQETSSRNSEVIHSGIYYPVDSFKTRWCIEGRQALYTFCARNQLPIFARTGKLLVAVDDEEGTYVEKLAAHCQTVDVPFERLTGQQIETRASLVRARQGLLFPESGIIDSHILMAFHEQTLTQNGGLPAYRHTVESCERIGAAWDTILKTPDGPLRIRTPIVINAAGLGAAELTNRALGTTRYEHRYCRGRYFSLSGKYQGKFQHLVYPVPPKDGLGTHVTIDLTGAARLGPDVDWCPAGPYTEVNRYYDCDWDLLRDPFLSSVQRYCPNVQPSDISPGLIGIRPKLFIDGKAHPDFFIQEERGFISCLGIESPGLTASLPIAEHVNRLVG